MDSKEFDSKKHMGLLIDSVNREVKKAIERGMSLSNEDPYAMKHGWLLGYLNKQDGPVFQSDMEKTFHFPKSTLADMIQSLERAGYIKKVPVDGDGRKKQIIVTEHGLRFNEIAEEEICAVEDYMIQGITDDQIQITVDVLLKMRQNAAEYKAGKKKNQKED